MTVEFSRPVALDTIGEGAREIIVEADEPERAALARRFDLVEIGKLSAKAVLTRDGDVVSAIGELRARVVQACVATATPLPVEVKEAFSLRFIPMLAAAEEEVELDADACDTVEYDGGAIDLGEAVAETMALSLDPFPRSPDADEILKEAGVLGEGDFGPFAALKALKDKMGG
jgi:uncharacterized metal-binding protein YceD (DUF177 family)